MLTRVSLVRMLMPSCVVTVGALVFQFGAMLKPCLDQVIKGLTSWVNIAQWCLFFYNPESMRKSEKESRNSPHFRCNYLDKD